MENRFGKYIKAKRKEKGINLRKFAELIDKMAPAYLSDIEKGNRYPPDRDKIAKMAEVLGLDANETAELYDLAAFDRASVEKEKSSAVASDLPEYIMSNDKLRVALRMARDSNAGDDDWIKVIEMLEGKGSESE
ncbi:MAG: helix-turn-helix domain-containing protein [Christensenellaceae bacterium]|jgi:transcriptional regulator with XRE-family HTH domain|nr:helix-turn-helix domain-containing protein [Christensenellaceae bacterium]